MLRGEWHGLVEINKSLPQRTQQVTPVDQGQSLSIVGAEGQVGFLPACPTNQLICSRASMKPLWSVVPSLFHCNQVFQKVAEVREGIWLIRRERWWAERWQTAPGAARGCCSISAFTSQGDPHPDLQVPGRACVKDGRAVPGLLPPVLSPPSRPMEDEAPRCSPRAWVHLCLTSHLGGRPSQAATRPHGAGATLHPTWWPLWTTGPDFWAQKRPGTDPKNAAWATGCESVQVTAKPGLGGTDCSRQGGHGEGMARAPTATRKTQLTCPQENIVPSRTDGGRPHLVFSALPSGPQGTTCWSESEALQWRDAQRQGWGPGQTRVGKGNATWSCGLVHSNLLPFR